jgi:hypothetical protein
MDQKAVQMGTTDIQEGAEAELHDRFCSRSGMQATRQYHQERERNEAARLNGNHARQIPTLDQRLMPVELDEFLSLKIPPRKKLLAPILPEKGLVMLYAGRDIGKTHIAHGLLVQSQPAGGFLNGLRQALDACSLWMAKCRRANCRSACGGLSAAAIKSLIRPCSRCFPAT